MSLDFSNERYVRLYTRDTVTWRLWDWQARGMWAMLLRVVDRAGVLDLQGQPPAVAVAAMLNCPLDVAERCLEAWTSTESVRLTGVALVIPNFIEAQETKKSDRQRQRESRAARRAKAMQEKEVAPEHRAPRDVTFRDESSRNVTDCHAVSRGVTDGHSVLCCAVPSKNLDTPPKPPSGGPTSSEVKKPKKSSRSRKIKAVPLTDEQQELWDYWLEATGRQKQAKRWVPNSARRDTLQGHLELYDLDGAKQIVSAVAASPWHRGQNDRNTRYDTLDNSPLASPAECAKYLDDSGNGTKRHAWERELEEETQR